MAGRFTQDIGGANPQGVITGGVVDNTASSLVGLAKEGVVAIQRERVTSQAEQDLAAVDSELADNLSVLSQLRQKHRDAPGTPTEVAKARAEIERLDAGVRQGIHRPEQADVRRRAILQRAINNAPLFAQELRQLGQTTGGRASQFANEETAVLAGLDKAVRKKADELYGAGNWGVAEEEGIRDRMRVDADAADLINRSQVTAPKFRAAALNLFNNAGHDILVTARRAFNERGALTQEDIDNYKTSVNELRRSALTQLRSHVASQSVSLTDAAVKGIEDSIDSETEQLLGFVDGKRVGERLAIAEKTRAALLKANSPMTDEVMRVMNLGGESSGQAMLQMLFATPQQKEQIKALGGESLEVGLPAELKGDIQSLIVQANRWAVESKDLIPPGFEKLYAYTNQQRVKHDFKRRDITVEEANETNAPVNLADSITDQLVKNPKSLREIVDIMEKAPNKKAFTMNKEANARLTQLARNQTSSIMKQFTEAAADPTVEAHVFQDGTVEFTSTEPDPEDTGDVRPTVSRNVTDLFRMYTALGMDTKELVTAFRERVSGQRIQPEPTPVEQPIDVAPVAPQEAAQAPLADVTGEVDTEVGVVTTEPLEKRDDLIRTQEDPLEVQDSGELTKPITDFMNRIGEEEDRDMAGLPEPVGVSVQRLDRKPNSRQARLVTMIEGIADRNDIDQDILVNQAWVESSMGRSTFNKKSGATGLFQFLPSTWGDEGAGKDINDDRAQAEAAARYLSKLKKRTGRTDLALASYNWGLGNVRKWLKGDANMPTETRNYVKQIMGVDLPVKYTGRLEAPTSVEPQAAVGSDILEIKSAFPDATIAEIREFMDSRQV